MPIRLAVALIVTLLAAFPALASPSCMTKHEARAQYKTSYLYWRTKNHCWYAGHASARHAKRSAWAVRSSLPFGESEPAVTQASARADTVWPVPPTDFTWADRWPDERRMAPGRWLFDLRQFGGGR